MKPNRCPSCNMTIFDLEGDIFFGKSFDYWIDLQTRVEEIDGVKLMDEIVRLKAKLYTYQEAIEKLNKEVK